MDAVDRRAFLRTGLAACGLGLAAGCDAGHAATVPRWILPTDPRVRAVEAARYATGRVVPATLKAEVGPVDLGGLTVHTWTYGGVLPGREIRVRRGDVIAARLVNHLPAATTVHWHGLALRDDMDGVPGITQAATSPGDTFAYHFKAPAAGTYWLHPHTGLQLDRGLYAPLIIEDPEEPADYDHDWTVVVDDWADGVGGMPTHGPATMRAGGMAAPMSSRLLGGDAGDVRYPHYIINGRLPTAPVVFRARPGQRARIRIINAGADTAFRVAVGGHRMTVTHADGYPVVPVEVDALLIGMGERYDVEVALADGVFPLVALAEGKDATARALIRTGAGTPGASTVRPAELTGRLLRYADLSPADQVRLPARPVEETHTLRLTGSMASRSWGIDGVPYSPNRRVPIRDGRRVRVTFQNTTAMWHPMHIHGHTFAAGATGVRKDTVIVLPGETVACDFDADNPGVWMAHCHNLYHQEAGMMTLLGYQT